MERGERRWKAVALGMIGAWGGGALGGPVGGLCAVELYLLGASVRVKINKWKQQQSPLVDEEKTSGVGGENELLGK